MNKNKFQKEERQTNYTKAAAYFYVAAMIGVFPLFYKNNYIDIAHAKKEFFLLLSGLLIVIAGITVISQNILSNRVPRDLAQKKHLSKSRAIEKKNTIFIHATDLFFAVFLFGILVSTFASKNRGDAFFAESGRQLGALMLLVGILIYYILKTWLKPTMLLVWIFLIANSLVFLLAILNTWSIDPLGMYQNLLASQRDEFIGTMGNLNISAGYFCMVLPVFMVMFLVSETISSKIIYGAELVLASLAAICVRSDSVFLGMWIALLILLWFAFESIKKLADWLGLLLLLHVPLFALIVVNHKTESVQFNGISGWMLDPHHLIPIVVVLLVLFLLTKLIQRQEKDYTIQLKRFRNVIFGFLVGVGMLLLVMVVVVNVLGKDRIGNGVLGRLILDDSFGTNRGYIWKRTILAYGDLPLWQKITGIGLNQFGPFIQNAYGAEMTRLFQAPYIDAHNEFLQFLVTSGVAGVAGYFGFLISALIRYWKRMKEQPLLLMTVGMIGAYIVQGLINNPQVFTTPLLFVYLGIAESLYQYKSE